MTKNNNDNSVTKKELIEVLGTFTEDVLLPAVENMMDSKFSEHTDKMENTIDQKIAKNTYEMKAYIDDKSAQQKGDIIEYIKVGHTNEIKKYVDSTLDSKLADQKGDIIEYIKGEHTSEMKAYIDEQKNDIISYIKGDRERDKSCKLKILDILKRNKLASPKELELLTDFAR